MDAQCRKAYVSVNVDIDEEGAVQPRRASSNKVGGGGIRYTVQIHGQEKYLFCEGNKWFVEARA